MSREKPNPLTSEQKIKLNKAKTIFCNYNRMRMEIESLKQSIEFYSKNIDKAIDSDIENASVTHPSENAGGFSANVSADKVPNIVYSITKMQRYYNSEISKLKFKLEVFEYAVNSIDKFIAFLSFERAEMVKQHFCNDRRMPVSEIAEKLQRSERGVRNIITKTIYDYSVTANYDFDAVIELLA